MLPAWLQARSSALYKSNRAASAAAIAFGGPAFAASFLLPWFPWGKSGGPFVILHFLVSWLVWCGRRRCGADGVVCMPPQVTMCLWDAMYTYVLLAHAALFADVETSNEGRTRIVAVMQIAELIAAAGPFVGCVRALTANTSCW